jgi:hypothetical protein
VRQVGAYKRFASLPELRSRDAHEPTFRQITLDQPQRQAPPADTGEDQCMLRSVVAHSPRAGRQHAEVAPFGQRGRVRHNNLEVARQFGRSERLISPGTNDIASSSMRGSGRSAAVIARAH